MSCVVTSVIIHSMLGFVHVLTKRLLLCLLEGRNRRLELFLNLDVTHSISCSSGCFDLASHLSAARQTLQTVATFTLHTTTTRDVHAPLGLKFFDSCPIPYRYVVAGITSCCIYTLRFPS
jgi:hypothetical protein